MGLSNSQYDAIMRRYSLKQADNQRRLDEHRKEAYKKLPQLPDLDRLVASESVRQARRMLEEVISDSGHADADGSSDAGHADAADVFDSGRAYAADGFDSGLRRQLNRYAAMRRELLAENGFPEDYLEMTYSCPDCQDTGYVGSTKCHCFRKEAIDLFYTQSGLRQILSEENFGTFSYEYYPEDMIHPVTGKSSREMMQETVAACLHFVDEFDHEFSNLFFYGGTGLGKTFLSHCIARELIEQEHSVMYYSAFDLFELFAQETFHRSEAPEAAREYLFGCDLLIIDDLGTELTNSFVVSQLFLLLNERVLRKKSTIISTNLSLPAFSETYSERVFSRITSYYQLFGLFGNDIRLQKKLKGLDRPSGKMVE